MIKRPSFTDLPLAAKPAQAAPPPPPAPAPTTEIAKTKDDRVTIIIRVSAEDRKALKGISVERDTTIQDLMAEAVKDIIRRSR